jgi:hypothetical protein
MGPTILLDKSAFQNLSSQEMHTVGRYFNWNRVDILLFEIVGDFLKDTKTQSRRNEASILADKISIGDSFQNTNYIELSVGNLLGMNVVMDGRGIISPTTIGQLEDGSNAAYIDETQFCETVYRWQKGDFTKEDEKLAKLWKGIKDNSKADDCFAFLQANHIILPYSDSIDELQIETTKFLRNPNMQFVLLDMFLSYQGINPSIRRKIRRRLQQCPYSLVTASPYAYYCLEIFLLFLGAYKFNLLFDKKADDQIDLEYLFYLPFCHVFSSNDKFHMTLAPPLMREGQVFLSGEDLKNGIREVESLLPYKETMKAKCAPIPPMPEKSIIRDVWIKTKWLYN